MKKQARNIPINNLISHKTQRSHCAVAVKVFAAMLPVLVVFISSVASAEPPAKRFLSPAKKFEVSFVELEHKKFTKEDLKQGFDNVSNVHYRIDFFKKGAATPITSVSWHDVYGVDMERPAPIKALASNIRWSPSEDFVILPNEGWATGPGTAPLRAIALNQELKWKEVSFTIEQYVNNGLYVWRDDMSFFGDAHEDCAYSVSQFDGRFGAIIEIKPAASPVGFELIAVRSKDKAKPDRIEVRQVTDNCAPIGSPTRPPRCFSIDLETNKESGIKCP